MSRSTNQAKALIDAWYILVRYRWRFIFPLFIVTSVVLALCLTLPRKYKAEAVFDRRTDQILAEILRGGVSKTFDEHRQNVKEELAGTVAISQVIKDLDPYVASRVKNGWPRFDLETLRQDLHRKTLVRFDINSADLERIRVSYTGSDPEMSRLAVNLMVRNYVAQARKQIERGLSEAEQFFQTQAQTSREGIEKLENQKLTFEIEHAALLPDSPTSITAVQVTAEQAVATAQQALASAEARIKTLSAEISQTPETVSSYVKERNPDLLAMQVRLREMQGRLRTMTTVQKMTEQHPEVVDLRSQMAEVEQKISQTESEVVTQQRFEKNPKRAELEVMLTRAVADQQASQEELTRTTARLDSLSGRTAEAFPIRAEYRKLNRDIDQLQRQVGFWEENLRRVQMARSADSGNRGVQISFVQPCPRLSRPISPDLLHILTTALGLGVMAGAVSLLFAHRTDETFHDGEVMARSVSLPLIGTVSEIISAQQARSRRFRNLILYPAHAAIMGVVLIALIAVNYLNLERPSQFIQLRHEPVKFMSEAVENHWSAPTDGEAKAKD